MSEGLAENVQHARRPEHCPSICTHTHTHLIPSCCAQLLASASNCRTQTAHFQQWLCDVYFLDRSLHTFPWLQECSLVVLEAFQSTFHVSCLKLLRELCEEASSRRCSARGTLAKKLPVVICDLRTVSCAAQFRHSCSHEGFQGHSTEFEKWKASSL